MSVAEYIDGYTAIGSKPPPTLIIAQYEAQACTYCAWQEHVAIVEAIEQRDSSTAAPLMTQHLDHLESKLLKHH